MIQSPNLENVRLTLLGGLLPNIAPSLGCELASA